jgi:polysaccharide transporter, PST family
VKQKILNIINNLTPNIKKMAGNSIWLFIDRAVRMVVGFIVWIWIARYLGPEQFGLYNYALAIVSLLAPIATLGLDNLVIRDVVKNSEHKYEILGTAFWLRITGGSLTFFISLAIIFILRPNDPSAKLMVGIAAIAVIFQSFDIIDFWFQSLVKSKYTVIAKNAAFLISAGFRVALILAKASVVSFAWMNLVESALAAIGMVIFYQLQNNDIRKWIIKFERVKKTLKDCLLITLSNSAVLLYMKIDVLILGQLSDQKSIGIYSAATKVSEVSYFFAGVIASSAFPLLIEQEEAFNTRLRRLFHLMALVSYAIMIPIAFLSPFIISVFGAKYAASSPVLSVHVWATIFVFIGMAQTSWYIKQGTKGLYIQLIRTTIGAILNIGLNFILIPKYNSMGAAIATIISYAYVGYFANMFSKKSRDIFIMQTKSLLLWDYFKKGIPQ